MGISVDVIEGVDEVDGLDGVRYRGRSGEEREGVEKVWMDEWMYGKMEVFDVVMDVRVGRVVFGGVCFLGVVCFVVVKLVVGDGGLWIVLVRLGVVG